MDVQAAARARVGNDRARAVSVSNLPPSPPHTATHNAHAPHTHNNTPTPKTYRATVFILGVNVGEVVEERRGAVDVATKASEMERSALGIVDDERVSFAGEETVNKIRMLHANANRKTQGRRAVVVFHVDYCPERFQWK